MCDTSSFGYWIVCLINRGPRTEPCGIPYRAVVLPMETTGSTFTGMTSGNRLISCPNRVVPAWETDVVKVQNVQNVICSADLQSSVSICGFCCGKNITKSSILYHGIELRLFWLNVLCFEVVRKLVFSISRYDHFSNQYNYHLLNQMCISIVQAIWENNVHNVT